MEFILASSSPRRKQLLSTIISNFDIIPSDIDENKLKKLELNPQKLAEKLSYEKAYSIFIDKYKENNEYTVIGSDTLVSFGNIILGKPKDRDDAIRILKLLQEMARKEKMTVAIITHNGAIAPMADKVIHFKNGTAEKIEINDNPISIDEIEW